MSKGVANKRYMPEFKVMVVETMHREGLSYCETTRQFKVSSDTRIASWERIYLTEGAEGFLVERRGRGSKGRMAKLAPKVEEDLRAEVAYLKNLQALVLEDERKARKNRWQFED